MQFEQTQLYYKNRFPRLHALIVWAAAITAMTTLIIVPGFRITGFWADVIMVIQFAVAWLFVVENIINIVLLFNRKTYIKRNWLVMLAIAAFVIMQSLGIHAHLTVKIFLLLAIVLVFARLMRNIRFLARRPMVSLIGSFALVITIGTLILCTPGAGAGKPVHFIDALFTSTSATCVTGLIVRDTFTEFSDFGHFIILILIQIGGLGLMTFGAFFALTIGGGYGIRDRKVMTGLLETGGGGTVTRMIVFILLFTFAFEAAGFLALNGTWEKGGALLDADGQQYYSAFHSISSFCNAGFSFFEDSFITLRDKPAIALAVPLLVIVGGLGFAVSLNLLTIGVSRVLSLFGKKRAIYEDLPIAETRLTVHTKLVLITTLVLLVLGFGVFYLLEANNPKTLGPLDGTAQIAAAFFQSVTARTAGFNTVEIGDLKDATKFFLIMMMFIGASPGSTGGGIKTVTLAVLALTLWATIRGRKRVEVYRRTIPEVIVKRAFLIAILGVFFIAVIALTLSITESKLNMPFIDILFESASAFGTVGLSTGITAQLTDFGKVLIMILMFMGRIGPLTIFVAIIQKTSKTELPEERVMVG